MSDNKLDRIRWILTAQPSPEYAPMMSALAYVLAMLLVRESRRS